MPDEKSLDNSETNDELDADQTAENNDSTEQEDKDAPDSDVEADEEEEELPDYRKTAKKDPATAKIIAQKNDIKALKKRIAELESGGVNKEDKDELEKLEDDEARLEKLLDKKLAEREAQAKNEAAFEKHFKDWAKDKPEREAKKEFFKEISFNPKYLNLKTFDDMEKKFFPTTKKSAPEGGSQGTGKGAEKVDFAKLSDNPEQYKRVMGSPKLKKEYFDWQDAQGI